MSFIKQIKAALVMGSIFVVGTSYAELVLDPAPVPAPAANVAPTASIEAPKAEAPKAQVQETRIVVVPMPAPAPAVVDAAAETTEQKTSKSELIRRQRMREELKNEDLLQERLESLRLKDEQKRPDRIMKDEADVQPAAAPVQTQVITAPVTENPGQDRISTQQSSAVPAGAGTSTSEDDKKKVFSIGISPRAGFSSMKDTDGYNINARFSTGLGLNIGVSENVSIETGYQYSEYGLKFAPGNGFVEAIRSNTNFYNDAYQNRDTHNVKQNVFDVGMRLYLLDTDSRVRPFIGGGGGYARTYLNYEKRYIDAAKQSGYNSLAKDYEISQFLGYLTAGMDVRINKSISIGLTGRYYSVLTSQEEQPLNNSALVYGYYNGPSYFNTYNDPAKQYLGGSIARANFYSVLVGMTFEF